MKTYRFTLPVSGNEDIHVEGETFEDALENLRNGEYTSYSIEVDFEREATDCFDCTESMKDFCNNHDD